MFGMKKKEHKMTNMEAQKEPTATRKTTEGCAGSGKKGSGRCCKGKNTMKNCK